MPPTFYAMSRSKAGRLKQDEYCKAGAVAQGRHKRITRLQLNFMRPPFGANSTVALKTSLLETCGGKALSNSLRMSGRIFGEIFPFAKVS